MECIKSLQSAAKLIAAKQGQYGYLFILLYSIRDHGSIRLFYHFTFDSISKL